MASAFTAPCPAWWVSRCGLPAPALPSWTTPLGWFVAAAGVHTCAPPGRAEQAVPVYPAPAGQEVAQAGWHWGFPPPRGGSSAVLLGGGGDAVGTLLCLGVGCRFPSFLSSASLEVALAWAPGRGQPSLLGICLPVCHTQLGESLPISPGCHSRARARRRYSVGETPVRLVHRPRDPCLPIGHTAQC